MFKISKNNFSLLLNQTSAPYYFDTTQEGTETILNGLGMILTC